MIRVIAPQEQSTVNMPTSMRFPHSRIVTPLRWLSALGFLLLISPHGVTQEKREPAVISGDGTAAIVIQTQSPVPEPPLFYAASASAKVKVGAERIEQTIELTIKIVQGDAETLSFGLTGNDEVVSVQDENLVSWAVRQEGDKRFLDLHLKKRRHRSKTCGRDPLTEAAVTRRSAVDSSDGG